MLLEISDYTTAAIRSVGQFPEDMHLRLRSGQVRYGKLWQALFEEAKDRGEIPADLDGYAARLLIIGALNWAPEWWNDRQVSVDEVVATARRLTLHGLALE